MADFLNQTVDATSAALMSFEATDILSLESSPVDRLSDDILGRIFSNVEPVPHGEWNEMDATKEVPVVGNEGDNGAAVADIDLNLEDFVVDMEINGSEADLKVDADNEDEARSAEGVSNETEDIAVKLHTQITEQNILIGEQHYRIQNLEADSVKLHALIEKLTREVQSIPKGNDTSSFILDLQITLQFVQDQLKKQEKHISVLQTQFREIRSGNLYQPAPAAE
ncbi:unnamed protein product [Closterium sp. NIES-65]|nr:unnamed protein product [Closterium sp. NIES-65]